MIEIFGSGVDGHIRLPMCIKKRFHSPGATAQLSGARSTAELIAHSLDRPPCYPGKVTQGEGGGPACNETGEPNPPPIEFSYIIEG